MENIYIGLGSNIDDPTIHISTAITEIKAIKQSQFLKCSQLYRSPPMGPQDQPDYINAVVKICSRLSANILLDELQNIENKHDRMRTRKWGPRSLDLDILLYGSKQINTNRLKIPHPGLSVRAFVLYPLFEIEPSLRLPNGRTVQTELESLGPQDIIIIN